MTRSVVVSIKLPAQQAGKGRPIIQLASPEAIQADHPIVSNSSRSILLAREIFFNND